MKNEKKQTIRSEPTGAKSWQGKILLGLIPGFDESCHIWFNDSSGFIKLARTMAQLRCFDTNTTQAQLHGQYGDILL